MKTLVSGLMTLLLVSSPVMAAKPPVVLQATGPDFTVRVFVGKQCTSAKIAKILKDAGAPFTIKEMIRAEVTIDGKKINACAAAPGNGAVIVVGEDERGAVLPEEMFVEQVKI